MPSRKTTYFAQLTDADEFESLVRDLCAFEWGDPHTQKFGRRGQKQFGVDVYGKPIDLDGLYRAAQCKLRSRTHHLDKKEIENEVHDARHFPHSLDALIVATDAPRDTRTQILVDQISDREVGAGNFRVAIWFWEDITERLAAHPILMVSYYKDYFASLTTLPIVEKLVDIPLHVAFRTIQPSSDVSNLQALLQLRGIRTRKPGELQTVFTEFQSDRALDGLIFEYNRMQDESDTAAIQRLAGTVQRHVGEVDKNCPVFAVLPEGLRRPLLKCIESLGGDTQRLAVLADELPCNEIADRIFGPVFDFGYGRRGSLTTIDITARTSPSKPCSALLDIDWCSCLGVDCFPDAREWQETCVPALEVATRAVLSLGEGSRIQIDCRFPLPAAIALGYYFNLRVARIGVWARRVNVSDFKKQLWMSDGEPANSTCSIEWMKQTENGGHSAIVELTTQVSIHKAVEIFARRAGLTADMWIEISLNNCESRGSNIDEGVGVAYANTVGKHIRHLNAMGVTDIHLFARMPSALAVLIGQRLQACGRVHLYWFDNPTYRFAFTLE